MFARSVVVAALIGTNLMPSVGRSQQPATSARTSGATDCAALKSTPMEHTANMDHAAHMAALRECDGETVPTAPGQAAFGAISEVVRILETDPATDWSKVNIEALRQHLIDMDDVTLHAVAKPRNVAGGIAVEVTGMGRTIEAIRRMTINHSRMLEQGIRYHASAREIPGGARLVVTAKDVNDSATVARIRGLGFAGLLTEGNHHAAHHIAIARGEMVHLR